MQIRNNIANQCNPQTCIYVTRKKIEQDNLNIIKNSMIVNKNLWDNKEDYRQYVMKILVFEIIDEFPVYMNEKDELLTEFLMDVELIEDKYLITVKIK